MKQAGSFNSALPILSLYVFAGYRLMPALQQVYASLTILKFIGPSVEKLHEDIKSLNPLIENQSHEVMPLNNTITLKNIHYNYPNTSRTAINGINLNIPAKSTVGFIGITGSGKTTVVDIILGLLEVQKGTLEVDGKVITKQNSRSWQRSIGYVPQHIYLADDTVAANIAFGLETKDINEVLIEKAAKIANLHQFVIDELPNQYQTIVGENGVRLSGGQRQRIGIARALYRNPKLLILDEPTSSLDKNNEKLIIDEIHKIKDITLIVVTHNEKILTKFDKIISQKDGKIKKIRIQKR
jgi:ABC-type multidrug transport system fused ATPase/permease subunit